MPATGKGISAMTLSRKVAARLAVARPFGDLALGQALGVALAGEAEAAVAGLAAQGGNRRDAAAQHQGREDAADGGDGSGEAFAAQEPGQLALAHIGL